MKPLFGKILKALGIDGAISYTILGKGLGTVTTIFTVFFIARYLSPDEQGYYYTFASVLSIQVFFELGLNNIITQFVAHESSYLRFNNQNELEGPDQNKSRLAYLLKFSIKWYLIFACILLVALLIIGSFFFKKYSTVEGVVWLLPWILLAISSVFNFLTSPINAFIQGLGRVKEIAKIRFFQQMIVPIVVWGGLMLGAKLFVSGLQTILIVVVNVYFYKTFGFFRILRYLYKYTISAKVNYLKEIFPYQWKIALSWVSGYFTFQLFNPILFAVEGAASAGRMGMTISAATAIQAVLLSWINTKIPLFSTYIEQKKYKELDTVFISNLKRIIVMGLALYLVFVTAILLFQDSETIVGDLCRRFTTGTALIFMSLAISLQIPIYSWATYLRCHLKEPFLINSIVMGGLSCLLAAIFGTRYGTIGLASGYLLLQISNVIWSYNIFKTKRNEWH